MKIEVKFKKLEPDAIVPYKATEGAGAYDLFVPTMTVIKNGATVVPTNLAMQIPDGFVADIRPRSGNSAKGVRDIEGDRHPTFVILGTIDCDYRGNIGIITYNPGLLFVLEKGERLAQILFHQAAAVDFVEVNELTETERGERGFGSTDEHGE